MAKDSMYQQLTRPFLLTLSALVACLGCASMSLPWKDQERTSIITPSMRIAAIQEIAARAKDADADERQKLTEQLATQIQTEPDPLVRQAIQAAMAEMSTDLARDVLIAGLQDDDLDVRLTCCEGLGREADPSVISALRVALETDEELDVQLAAIDALGQIRSPQSVAALATAVNDRDPALQYAGVQALKAVSGKDLGNDVTAWRQYAASEQPEISLAERPQGWSPF
ncbi:MAG: HEAT repeat domain-containing protein [Planctomycetota bacterium]